MYIYTYIIERETERSSTVQFSWGPTRTGHVKTWLDDNDNINDNNDKDYDNNSNNNSNSNNDTTNAI